MNWWQRVVQAVRGGPAYDVTLKREAMRFVDLPDLDEALRTSVDDAPWHVYADWLEEQGDARAELVRRYHRNERFEEFVAANATELFGPLAPFLGQRASRYARPAMEVEWRHGLVAHAALRMEKPWRWVPTLWRTPVTRFLGSLAVGLTPTEDLCSAEELQALADPRARAVRKLLLGDFIYPDECEMSWAQVGDVSALWSLMPQLEELKLRGAVADLGDVQAPNLVRFTRETSQFTRDELARVLAASWPRLEHLELWFGEQNYGANCTAQDVVPLFGASRFPRLTSLGLCNFEGADAIIEPLAASGLLRQVKRLDLSKGILTDEGAATMLKLRAKFEHLEHLDLSRNLISEAMTAPLSELCASVNVEAQRLDQMDEGMRFVAVGE